jgi:hypothetical protein
MSSCGTFCKVVSSLSAEGQCSRSILVIHFFFSPASSAL